MNTFLAFISMPGGSEIFIIFLIVLLLFGARKLPELARGLGQSLNEFRRAKDEFNHEIEKAAKEAELKEIVEVKPAGTVVGTGQTTNRS